EARPTSAEPLGTRRGVRCGTRIGRAATIASMRSRAVLLVVLASACTRLNPAFDVVGDTPHTNTSGAGGTTGHDEVGDGSVSSTKAPGTGEADATSMGSSTMAE